MKHASLGLVLGLFLFGCGDDNNATNPAGTGNGMAAIRVMLTDAPSDYIATAEVVISRVYLKASAEDAEDDGLGDAAAAGEIDLLDETDGPITLDLLQLRDGLEALLGEVPVEPGVYHQLRLVVDDATLTLVDGYEFPDGTNTAALKTPSAHKSGIKVQLADPIPADEGKVTIVVVDFDVNDNFVIQGNPDTPAGIKGVLFKPVLKEKSRVQEDDTEGDDL